MEMPEEFFLSCAREFTHEAKFVVLGGLMRPVRTSQNEEVVHEKRIWVETAAAESACRIR